MLSNLVKNSMGTVSFDGKFTGMRKHQEFTTYPLQESDDATKLTIQSDTRIGIIHLVDGCVFLCPPVSSGAYMPHLTLIRHQATLSAEDLLLLKAQVMSTASGKAGNNGIIYCDNSEAISVFGKTEGPEPTGA